MKAEGSGHWFFVAFPVCLLILFIWFKGRRVRFLIPSLIISIVIINPWFYRAWDKLGLYAYWRILWVIPVIPVVAGLVPSFTERIQKSWMKSIVVAAGVGAVMVGGMFIYNGAGGSFVEAANASKEPDYVVQIADRLLELDEHPRVIAQDPLGLYLRQYSGSIDTLYGRDLHGYITGGASKDAIIIRNELSNQDRDLISVSQFMLNDDYDFLVTTRDARVNFELVERVADYGIYRAVGNPSEIKARNEFGQIMSITSVDAADRPIDNEDGFATVSYSYDENGFIDHTSWFTASNAHYVQPSGYYELNERYDRKGNLLTRSYLDANGIEANRLDGFSRTEWKTGEVDKVILLDNEGSPIDITGVNLVKDADGTWSEWITPEYDISNSSVVIDTVVLGEKNSGDFYSCQIEIEFKDVTVTEG